jgi:uncharacterized NAD-dependent epimerase/dehydratase family protein
MPHAMVMCGQPSRKRVRNHDWLPIPSYPQFIRLHEQLAEHLRPAPVIAIALNTSDLSERDALDAIARTSDETGLPCTDPVRFDAAPVADAIDAFHRARVGHGAEAVAAR